jgi:hypothetical protein
MKKTLLAILLAVALTVIPVSSVLAANTADVTVTATPGWVSITNTEASFGFGVVNAGDTPNTGTGWATITNSSTIAMDINIQCDGWSPVSGSNSWSYGASGPDTAQLNASSANGGAGGSSGAGDYDITVPAVPPGSAALLCDAVAVGVSPSWELELEAPSSFTHVDEQTTTVTLTAVPD